ncbi:hypothetical protein MNBD_ALPHA06-943 [hydrothermal vent metagenome]|uniref:Uncharacterized protein n=1 Tax=hydrothermal vent metagenome TaxID=652676 RepID=A0A3B0T4Q6_9ZZZZ
MDVIALAATIGNTGIVNTGGTSGVFTVAVSNIGVAGTVVVSGETSSAAVTAIVTVCETNPVDSQCLATPSATVSRTLAQNETATFGFFVAQTANIVPDFAAKRIFAKFSQGTTLRGATSVAVTSGP